MRRLTLPFFLALLACPIVEAQVAPLTGDVTPPVEEASVVGPTDSRASTDLDDSRRSLGRFVPNIGRNLVGVFSRESLRPLLAGAALTGIAARYDDGTQRLLRNQVKGFGQAGGEAGRLSTVVPLTVGLFAFGRASGDTRFRAASYDMAQASIVTGLYTEAFKRAVGRLRPDGSDTKSFPSGHTSNAFAWATVAQHHYGAKAGLPAYAAASLIGLSRIERDKHHLSDVVAGATLGFIVGRTVAREDGEPVRRERRITLVPMTDASGAGLGAGVHVEF